MNPQLLARAIGAARLGFGIGMLAAPDQLTRRWIGSDANLASTQVVTRGLGGRDLVLGVGALISGGAEQQRWLVAGAAADASDLAGTLAAGRGVPLSGRIAVVAVAGGAIALGGYTLAGLRGAS